MLLVKRVGVSSLPAGNASSRINIGSGSGPLTPVSALSPVFSLHTVHSSAKLSFILPNHYLICYKMPPNTPSNPTHPPITPVTPVQQSIRNFFRPDLNQLVANVFDLPPSPSGPPAHSPSPAGAMAIHDNRKRDRDDNDSSGSVDDSIFGLDTVSSQMSASLIANTSIARRIRLSSETLPPAEITSTPVTLSQQMHDIRQSVADNNVDTSNVNQVVMADAHDRSSHSNTLNILHMVDGINVITRQAANVVEHRQAFEWDDTGMAPTLPHISPRPLPNIQDDRILTIDNVHNVVPSEGNNFLPGRPSC